VLFITSPNNPTGSYITKYQVDELISILPDHVLLVFDEVYYQYVDAEDYVRALPYVLKHSNVIAVNSFSKAYGLAGLRIGYSYASEQIATYLRKFRIPFMLNTLSMEAAIAAMQDEEFIERTVSLIHKEKQYLYKELDSIGQEYWKTQANFILVRPQITPLQFEAKMIKFGVMVRPLVGFGAPDCVRVTIGTHEANEAFISALRKIS
ncbi:MAG: aminotransferase class I/II-fold pyridoxal phosphate-dependent enzyme, partial [Flavobacteriaceae bacterium]|nr:aminotransferase class I/II-fold pyridoxal phosphate-dependent enzyme [Flavobacteriaceae bacterium]